MGEREGITVTLQELGHPAEGQSLCSVSSCNGTRFPQTNPHHCPGDCVWPNCDATLDCC